MCRIVSLQAENIKRLKAVKITPDGSMVVVGGENGAGKSSVLDSIMYALAGGKSLPAKPLRNGAKKGSIKLDLGETSHGHLIVERTFTEKGSSLVIRSKDGYEAPTPQKILDELCGKLSFDPLEFSRQKPKEQLAMLRDLVGIDFSGIDQERANVFAARTGVNRDLKQLEGELAGLVFYEGVPEETVSVSDLAKQVNEANQHNRKNDESRNTLAELERQKVSSKQIIADIQDRIDGLQRELDSEKAELAALTDDAKDAKVNVDTLVDQDVAPIQAQIETAEETNAKVRANAKRSEVEVRRNAKEAESKKLTVRLEAIDESKEQAIQAAKFPVEGLGFGDDGITLGGLPFDQASSAERIRVSAAMGMAMNPELRVMLIRDGSLLGKEALAMLAEMADENDAQIWLERVSDGAEVSVVIEDGAVKETRLEAAAV